MSSQYYNMSTPDLLGQLAEVSQLQLTQSIGESSSEHEPSPIVSTDSHESPDSIRLNTYNTRLQPQPQPHSHAETTKITRQRQQVSCAECHRRKQSCNRQIPCSRCIDRGIASQCHIAPKGANRVHRKSNQDQTTPDTTPPFQLVPEDAHPAVKKRRVKNEPATAGVLSVGHLINDNARANPSLTYLGPSSLLSVINQSLPNGREVPAVTCKLVHNPCGGSTKAPGVSRATMSAWLEKLPQRIVCDRLIDEFFTNTQFTHWLFSSSHKAHFMVKYRQMWSCSNNLSTFFDNQSADNPKSPLSLNFFAMCCLMICTTLQFLPEELRYLTEGYGELGLQLHAVARQALQQSELEDPPDMYLVEATLMDGMYTKHEGRPSEIYSQLATAVRHAQGLGMHRKAPPEWNITPLEDQLRKRLWWGLFCYDRIASLTFGRPYCVNLAHVDVDLPANIDDCDLTEEGPRNIQPHHIVTDMTYLLLQIKLAGVTGRVFDSCFSIQVPTYQTVLDLDQELHKLELSIPAGFRHPDTIEIHRRPYLRYSFGILLSMICRLREQLHRPYLIQIAPPGKPDPFSTSKTATVTLARRVLACLRDIRPFLHPKYFIPWAAYESGATLVVAGIMERRKTPNHDTPEIRLIDETVKDAMQLLEYGRNSTCNSLAALQALREQYLLPENQQADIRPDMFEDTDAMNSPPSTQQRPASSETVSSASMPNSVDTLFDENAWQDPNDNLFISPAGVDSGFLSSAADFSSWMQFQQSFLPNDSRDANTIVPLFAPQA